MILELNEKTEQELERIALEFKHLSAKDMVAKYIKFTIETNRKNALVKAAQEQSVNMSDIDVK